MMLKPALRPPLRAPMRGATTLREGGGAYLATLAALKTRLAADDGTTNPHDLAAMSSPPTVNTLAGNTPPTGITQGLRFTDSTILPYQLPLSGKPTLAGSFYEAFPVTSMVSGGNTTATTNTLAWRVPFKVTADKVAFRFAGNTRANVRFILGGQYISKTGHAFAGTSGSQYLYFDLPSLAEHHLIVEGDLDQKLDGIYVPTGQTVALEDAIYANIALFLGDSFIEAAGATRNNDGLAVIAGERLLYRKIWGSGSGGTGFVTTGGASKYKLAGRITADIQRALELGTVEMLVITMGINDIGVGGVQAEVEACLGIARALLPATVIFVTTGPWDVNAPSGPVTNYSTVKSAIVAGIGSRPGVYPIDMQGVAYTKFDSVHPDNAGHVTLGQSLASKIRAAIAAA